MSEQSAKKGRMAKDTIIYMLAKGIEGIVGVVTMSVMTYLFVTEQMGYYSNANIAITTVGMIFIQWLVQSVLRYINKYHLAGQEDSFYTTVFSAWLRVNAIGVLLLVLTVLGFSLALPDLYNRFIQIFNLRIILFGGLWFVTYNTAQLVIAMLAAIREAKLNLLLSMITVCGKLGFMVLFCKLWGSAIEWIFLSYFITDGIVSIIGLLRLRVFEYVNTKNNSPEILTELKTYGMPLMGNMLTTSVLNKSDIYIITALLTAGQAGIYQTNYSLIATAFTLLSASVMRGSYPTILRTWSEGKKELTEKLVSDAIRFYLLLSVPAVFGVAAISDVVAKALFEAQYFEGNVIMFWVALGMMFLGLTEYSIKPWELNANTKAIFCRSLIGGVVNVFLNIVFIKVFQSYYVAAVTTFIGFFVYFLLARFGTRKQMKWHLPIKTYARIILSGAIMFISLLAIKSVLAYTKINLVVLVALGAAVYGLVLAVSGEVTAELKVIINKIKK